MHTDTHTHTHTHTHRHTHTHTHTKAAKKTKKTKKDPRTATKYLVSRRKQRINYVENRLEARLFYTYRWPGAIQSVSSV